MAECNIITRSYVCKDILMECNSCSLERAFSFHFILKPTAVMFGRKHEKPDLLNLSKNRILGKILHSPIYVIMYKLTCLT